MIDDSAAHNMRFQRYGSDEELPDQIVTALVEDRSGLIWVGSTVGLFRFDGYTFHHFSRDPQDPNSLPGNYIRNLFIASDGRLWIGTEGDGAAVYDPTTGRFTRVPVSGQTEPGLGGSVHAIAEAADRTIFIGSSSRGLLRITPHANELSTVGHASGENAAVGDLQIESLQYDAKHDVLWIGTWNGLKRMAATASSYADAEPSTQQGRQPLQGSVLWSLLLDSQRRLWVGTQTGQVALVDADRGQLLSMVSQGSRSGDIRGAAQSLLQASDDEVWVGRGDGLERRRASDGELLQSLGYTADQPLGLAGNDIRALLRDRAGGVWLGGFGSGLMRYDTQAESIQVVRAFGPEFREGNINSVLSLGDGRVLLGSASEGLLMVDSAFAPLRHFAPGIKGMLAGRVRALAASVDEWVWVGGSSLLRLNLDTAEVDPYGERFGFVGRDVRRLLRGPDGSLWVGSLNGLHRVPPTLDQLQIVPVDGLEDPTDLSINALQLDAEGRLWVGALQGLFRYSPEQQRLQQIVSPAGRSLVHHSVTGLLIDRQQRLWVDTAEGLHQGVEQAGLSVAFEPVASNLGRSFGANLLQDANERIWTHRFVHDPADGSVHELTPADGVDFGIGWFRAYDSLPDGRLLFGGSKGLLVVEPWRYRPWRYEPPIVLTNLRIDGRMQVPLQGQRLVLQPGQRTLYLEFAALDYSQPGRNRYAYRLLGFEDRWSEVSVGQRSASYNSLAPGLYELQVRGSNRSGYFNPQPLSVPLEVVPAWWQTPLARFGQLLLAIAMLVLLIRIRTAYLHRQRDALELKVQERTRELEKASRIKSDFLANMSHEIRTPMNAIIGMSRLCLETALDRQQRDYVQKISHASEALLGIINDILDLSKIEAGKLQLEQAAFRLGDVVERVADLVSARAEEKSLALVLPKVDPELLLIGDSLRLGQVLWNLVGNAVKFTKRGDVALAIDAQENQQPGRVELRFSVRDSGIGMSPAQVESLFTPFHQADSSTTRLYGGTGLGLVISQRLVDAMGGVIQVDSQVGRGSEFHFTLSFAIASAGALIRPEVDAKAPWDSAAARRLRGKRVLVVDDVDVNRQVASEWLRRAGIEVVLASDGEQAVEQVRGGRFDAVLMDVQMPGMDGYAATREIRRIGRLSLPIIAMTANAMAEDRRQCLEAGMDDHLGKPVQPERMFAALAGWIEPEAAIESSDTAAASESPVVQHGQAVADKDLGDSAVEVWVDFDRVSERLAGNRELAASVLQSFAGNHRDWTRRWQQAWEAADAPQLQQLLHGLKGTSGTVGLPRLSRLAEQVEGELNHSGFEALKDSRCRDLCVAMNATLAAIESLQVEG